MAVKITRKKFDNLQACADERGIITAAAMDQRGSLQKALANLSNADVQTVQMAEFKAAVTEALSPHATAILLDPVYGLGASTQRATGTGLLLAYEKSGYDNNVAGRLPDLLESWSVKRLAEAGANAVKVLLYYNPYDQSGINERKQAFIERMGSECQSEGLPLFFEPITYDDSSSDAFDFAKKKPDFVKKTIQEFSKDRYGVDILKIEIPINAHYTEGLTDAEQIAYSRDEAMGHMRSAAQAASKPYIYLSAGVDMDVFIASLTMAGEAGVPYSGVLCGRATWKGGIPVYAKEGVEAFRAWLGGEGVANITRLNETVGRYAKPWWDVYGGKDNIEIIG